MKRKVRRKRSKKRPIYLLPQILPMKPYVFGLMADLRACRGEQKQLSSLAKVPACGVEENYQDRRRRHDASAALTKLRENELELLREFRSLGVRVGDVLRGEMFFPCLVDHRSAYFVWYDCEDRPTHWRFRSDSEMHRIPERWFSLYDGDDSCAISQSH